MLYAMPIFDDIFPTQNAMGDEMKSRTEVAIKEADVAKQPEAVMKEAAKDYSTPNMKLLLKFNEATDRLLELTQESVNPKRCCNCLGLHFVSLFHESK